MRTLVLGLGNEYAGDDAVGVLAVRALRGKLAGGADVVESAASGLALLEVFAGYDRAVIADSIRTGRSPAGTIVEVRLADLGLATAPSLHQAGIPELAAVARRLGMGFPDRTRVLAVEVAGPLMFGAPLSKPVAAAVAPLGRRVAGAGPALGVGGLQAGSACGRRARAGGHPAPGTRRSTLHDYHAVSALVARLTRDPSLATGIAEVRVRASPVFSPEALQQAYQMLTEDTPLCGSRLLVDELADRRECALCGARWLVSSDDLAGHLVVCPSCGALSPLDAGAAIELLEIRSSAGA